MVEPQFAVSFGHSRSFHYTVVIIIILAELLQQNGASDGAVPVGRPWPEGWMSQWVAVDAVDDE